jgi:hypothetical protein
MKRAIVAATVLAACQIAQAAPPDPPRADSQPNPQADTGEPKKKMKMKAKKPMKMDEPMKSPMARDGMMMGDVKASAAKKDAAMKDMMKQEEMKMPPANAPGTNSGG